MHGQIQLVQTGVVVTADALGAFAFPDVSLVLGANLLSLSITDVAGNTRQVSRVIRRVGPEIDGPVLFVALTHDTGRESDDLVTMDPTIAGTVVDDSTVLQLQAVLNDGQPVDILPLLAGEVFTLSSADLQQMHGGPLPDGLHVLRVSAVDEYLNESTPLVFRFRLDTQPPIRPDSPTLLSGNGPVNSEFVTLQVAAPLDLTVRFLVNDTVVTEQISEGVVLAPLGPLAEGSHTITVVTEDRAGHVSAASDPLTITIDLSGPATPTLELEAASDTPPMGDDSTSLESVTLVGRSSAQVDVALYRGDALLPLATTTADHQGDFTFNGITLGQGPNLLRVEATDAAGNRSQLERTFFSSAADTTAPVIQLRLNQDTGHDSTDGVTYDATVIGLVDEVGQITALQAGLDGSPTTDILALLENRSFTIGTEQLALLAGGELTDGIHSLQVRSQDDSGRWSDVSELQFSLDTQRPAPPDLPDLLATSDSGVDSSDNITRLQDLTVATTAEDGMRVHWFVEGAETEQAMASDQPVLLQFHAGADGRYRITATAEDLAGNISVFAPLITVTVDTNMPEQVTVSLAPESDSPPLGDGITTCPTVALTGQTEPLAQVTIPGTDRVATVDQSGRFTLAGVYLSQGMNRFEIQVSDAAGNILSQQLDIVFEDVDAPLISVGLGTDTGQDPTDRITSEVDIHASVTDASGIDSWLIGIDGPPVHALPTTGIQPTVRLTRSDLEGFLGGPLTDGDHLLTFHATDGFGHASDIVSFDFTLDTEAPVALRPNLLTSSDTGCCDTDDLTRDEVVVLDVPAEPLSFVRWYLGEQLVLGSLTDSDREVTFDFYREGIFEIFVTIEDRAGNLSELSPPLLLTIDSTPPRDFSLSLGDTPDGPASGSHVTLQELVTVSGITEPYAEVELQKLARRATADAQGVFQLTEIPLEPGLNSLTFAVSDSAGNVSSFRREIVREDRPLITVGLLHDTAQGGGEDDDFVTSDPSVVGTVTAAGAVAGLSAGLDQMNEVDFLDVTDAMTDGQFLLEADRLQQINGGPLTDGYHTLHLLATDEMGRRSEVTHFDFMLDLTPPTQLSVNVTSAAVGWFVYEYQVTNPATNADDGDPDQFFDFEVEVSPNAQIRDIVSPGGWTAHYSAGATQVAWTADGVDDSLSPGQTLTFSFSSTWVEESTRFSVVMTNEREAVGGVDWAIGWTRGPQRDPTAALPAQPEPVVDWDADRWLQPAGPDEASSTATVHATEGNHLDSLDVALPVEVVTENVWSDPLDALPPDGSPESWPTVLPQEETGGWLAASPPTGEDVQYKYKIIDSTTSGVTSLGVGPSINDGHTVAYTAQFGSQQNLVVRELNSFSARRRLLMNPAVDLPIGPSVGATQSFGPHVQINNQQQVIAQRRLDMWAWMGMFPGGLPVGFIERYPISYVEVWDGSVQHGLPQQMAMGDSGTISSGLIRLGLPGLIEGLLYVLPLPGLIINPMSLMPQLSILNPVWAHFFLTPFSAAGDFIAVYDNPSLNNNGLTSFGSWTGAQWTKANALISGPHQSLEYPLTGYGTPGFQPRPMVADTGQIVLQNGAQTNSPILVADGLLRSGQQLTDNLFTELGGLPGISDDGEVVTFVGTHSQTGAGLYAAVKKDGLFQAPVKLLGVAGDGRLDFGETTDDPNGDGVLQPGEDMGPDVSFDRSQRIGVNYLDVEADGHSREADQPRYAISFVTTGPDNIQAAYNLVIDLIDGAPQINRRTTVFRFDQPIPGLGTPTRIATYDPLNTSRSFTFWAEGAAGSQAIVTAHQNLGDVLLHRFGSAGTADNLNLPRVELEYEIQASTRQGDVQELSQPLIVGLYASDDHLFDPTGDSRDRLLGKIEILPSQFGRTGAIVSHELEGQSSDGSTFKSPGKHRLTLNPSQTYLQQGNGSTLLMDELERSINEYVLAVVDPDDQIPYLRDDPSNNVAPFAGVYQAGLGSPGVVRTATGHEDVLSVSIYDEITATDTVGLLDHDDNRITSFKFREPQDLRFFTVDRDDRVEAKLGLDLQTNVSRFTNRTMIVRAGDGFDRVFGGEADDYLFAGKDEDLADAQGFNLLVGRGGDDRLTGGDASDLLWGDDFTGSLEAFAQDILVDGRFNVPRDLRTKANGNDLLKGERGFDVLVGGDGADTLFGGEAERNLMFGDTFENAFGLAIDFRPFLQLNLDTVIDNFSFLANPELDLSKWTGVNLVGSGADTIHAEGRLDLAFGGGGNDTLYGRGLLSILLGNDGKDTIDATLSNFAVILGGLGNDTIKGADSGVVFGDGFTHDTTCVSSTCTLNQDTITGGTGVNVLIGGTGNDNIEGGGTVDIIFGDTFDLSYPQMVTYGKQLADFKITFLGAAIVPVGAGKDTIDGKTGGLDWIIGGDGDDTIKGSGVLWGDGFKFEPSIEISLSMLLSSADAPHKNRPTRRAGWSPRSGRFCSVTAPWRERQRHDHRPWLCQLD